MRLSRRKSLVLGTSLGVSSFSGCTRLPFVGPRLTLTLLNFDSEAHILGVEILRAAGGERSQSVALQEWYELPPPPKDSAAFELRKTDILESENYVVRAQLSENRSVRDSYRFYPDCTGNGEPEEELYIEIRRDGDAEDPYIRFQQNRCGSDSWWF